MNIDDDEPPSLVDVNGIEVEAVEEPKLVRVPITIVTGEITCFEIYTSPNFETRVSRGWKDYVA
jgi:hypothetical protein